MRGATGYSDSARLFRPGYTGGLMSTAAHELDLGQLIADTEEEILRLVQDHDPSTVGVYE